MSSSDRAHDKVQEKSISSNREEAVDKTIKFVPVPSLRLSITPTVGAFGRNLIAPKELWDERLAKYAYSTINFERLRLCGCMHMGTISEM